MAGMTLPDTRRLLQGVLAVAAPREALAQAIAVSDWRQAQPTRAAVPCEGPRRARKQQLRNTG